jgi:hypothetical protein
MFVAAIPIAFSGGTAETLPAAAQALVAPLRGGGFTGKTIYPPRV